MINLYEGNGYTKYVLRSGHELTLHEDDFREMLGFKDEMAKVIDIIENSIAQSR